MKRWAVALAIMSTLIAGCGGGGGSGGETRDQLSSEVVTTACFPSGDDSTKVDASLFGVYKLSNYPTVGVSGS